MGKKKIKRNKKGAGKKPATPKKVAVKDSTHPLKRVACVECDKDRTLVRMSECAKCQYHENTSCAFTSDPYRIRVVSMNEPMKYNRITFAISSSNVQDDARNYYFLTNIMQPTKHIDNCPEYTRLKGMLLRGELGSTIKDEPRFATEIKGLVYLEECSTKEGVCFYNNDKMYREVDEFYTGEAQWHILFYLYEMYSLDGLADIKIDDRFFKIKGQPIDNFPPSLVVAINGKNIVIGS